MKLSNELAFVRDEVKTIPGYSERPSDESGTFTSRIAYAFSLALKEKEIFVFGLFQLLSIAVAYILWSQLLNMLPSRVWYSMGSGGRDLLAMVILFCGIFLCIALAALPVGIFTACMLVAQLLRKQGKKSTLKTCLQMVISNYRPLLLFYWFDTWLTILRFTEMVPRNKNQMTAEEKAASKEKYHTWKLGVAGVLPGIITGHDIKQSGEKSIVFVKQHLTEIANLRAGFVRLSWVIGVLVFLSAYVVIFTTDIADWKGTHRAMYTVYFILWGPAFFAFSVIAVFIKPVYVLAIGDLYSGHIKSRNKKLFDETTEKKSVSKLVILWCIYILAVVAYRFRDYAAISDFISTLFK